MVYFLRNIFILSFVIFTAQSVLAESYHIFFTGSLNDKYSGCTCSKYPEPGLSRRFTIIKKMQKQYPHAGWLDTGDNVFGVYSPLQWPVLVNYWQQIKYDAIVFGDQEWQYLLQSKKKLKTNLRNFEFELNKLPLLNSRLIFRGQALPEPLDQKIIHYKKTKIGVLAYADKSIFHFTELRGQWKSESLAVLSGRIQSLRKSVNVVILISHSGLDMDKKIAGISDPPDIIISGHDQNVFKKPMVVGKTIIVGSGVNGGYIGELKKESGKQIYFRMHPLDFAKIKPDKKISTWVQEYEKKKANMF